MNYAYYPGCSLTESAKEYDAATRAVLKVLDVTLTEIPDWTCCGASAVEAVSLLLAHALPARNLALAEREVPGADVLAPCSACYLNLRRVQEDAAADKDTRHRINEALSAEDLEYRGASQVRHLLDVLVNDVGVARIRTLSGGGREDLVIAPYTGCQAIRPYRVFDDPERPRALTEVLFALGVTVHEWDMGGRCCGASLMATHKDAALASVAAILDAAGDADAIATVCPMCQMNLDAYQGQALKRARRDKPLSILYLPQLMGVVFGLSERDVMLDANLTLTSGFRAKLREQAVMA